MYCSYFFPAHPLQPSRHDFSHSMSCPPTSQQWLRGLRPWREHPHQGLLHVGVGVERARWTRICLCSLSCVLHFFFPPLQSSDTNSRNFINPPGVSSTHSLTVYGYRTHLNANVSGWSFSPYRGRTMQSELNIHRHYDSRWHASDSRKQTPAYSKPDYDGWRKLSCKLE